MARPKQTTQVSQTSSGFVTVTHPSHPLYGQTVEVIRQRRGADPDLIIRHPDGFHTAIAMSCTDYAASAQLPQGLTSPPLLDFTGLCQAVQLIAALRQSGRFVVEAATREPPQVSYD